MLRKDDILLTQPALWSKAKIYGQSIKYNQLMTENLESSTTTVPITNVVGTYVQVLEPSLVGHKVYVKIDYDNETRLGLCFFKAYQSSKGVPLGYNLVNGQEVREITAPTTETEGVYTITSDMVHSGTNYLQVYYFVYSGLPTGQKRMAVQFVDLTALGLDTIVNSVADFHNTPLGKVMQNNYWFAKTSGEIISAESPLKFYKGNTLLRTYTPTANPIVLRSVGKNMQSLLGKQNVKSQTISNTNRYIGFGRNNTYAVASSVQSDLTTFKGGELNSTHIYASVVKTNIDSSNFTNLYLTNGTAVNFKNKTNLFTKNYLIAINSVNDTTTAPYGMRISQSSVVDYKIEYALIIDLTELGLDTLTAQQFYDRYHNVFDELANGQSIPLLADTLTHHNGKLNRVFGEVDLGTLNWTYQSAQARFVATNIATLIKKPLATTEKANMLCAKYTTSDWSSAGGKDKVIYLNTNGNLGIRDTAYTDAQTFKTAMSGVKLIYELTTPTTENVGTLMIPKDFEKIVADNGVELGFDN